MKSNYNSISKKVSEEARKIAEELRNKTGDDDYIQIKKRAEEESTRIAGELGTMYRNKREAMKLSIREFSKRVNLSISTISELEKGYNIPRFETILYIGFCLDISIDDILNAIKPVQVKANKEVLKQGSDYDKLLKLCLYELNNDGINIVDEFIKFIKLNPKYLSKSAYKKQTLSLYK